jgi:hypothetical protein
VKARYREAEKFMLNIFRATEDRHGIPLALFDAYADAVERYDLQDWRRSEDDRTAGEMNASARVQHKRLMDAIPAYTLNGGQERWGEFEQALHDFMVAGSWAIKTSQDALHESAAGFSEFSDPAFAGLVERGDR